MSKPKVPSPLLAAVALMTCPMLATAGDASGFPTGVYAAKGVPATIQFKSGGRVRVSKGSDLKVDGSYKVDGDRIQLTDERGPWACMKPGEQTGSYQWKTDKGQLTFIRVADTCKDRVDSLTKYDWKKQ
jgi:hypothetical protein